jgi:hypothetical protein
MYNNNSINWYKIILKEALIINFILFFSEMFDQARNLVSRMRTWPGVDFNNDWKMVTFFIGK